LGNPVLPGWVPSGGDPCGQGWQGVRCNGSVIQEMYVTTFSCFYFTSIEMHRIYNQVLFVIHDRTLNGANLGGELGDSLGSFVSIRAM